MSQDQPAPRAALVRLVSRDQPDQLALRAAQDRVVLPDQQVPQEPAAALAPRVLAVPQVQLDLADRQEPAA